MLKILVADDHALIRAGLRAQLRGLADELVFLEAGSWSETRVAAAEPDLDLALVDLRMPGQDGLSALSELLGLHPGLPVLVLSASENLDEMRAALRLGAMGFVSKSEPPAVMVGAVRLVLGGGLYVPPALAGPGFDGRLPPAPEARLTARQVEVVRLLVEGRTNKEMATALRLSGATIKAHLAAVFRALGVENRTQAAIVAERLGLHRRAGG